jgi:hypothetical protein
MIYNSCTFLDNYSKFSPLEAYFLPTPKNEIVPVLGYSSCIVGMSFEDPSKEELL